MRSAGVADRRLLVRQSISGSDILKFRRRDDFTRHRVLHGILLLAFQAKQVPHFFFHLPVRNIASHVWRNFSRHHPHDRKLAGKRVDDRLKHTRRERRIRIGRAFDRFAVGGVDTLDFASLERRRQKVSDGVEQGRHADLAQRRAEKDRKDFSLPSAFPDRLL